MTPQLLQAIKLLQLSTIELNAYVDAELDRTRCWSGPKKRPTSTCRACPRTMRASWTGPRRKPGDWASQDLATSREALESQSR